MKKIMALALVFLALIPCAFAESIDYSSMTADQLKDVIAQARAALAEYEIQYNEGVVIYDGNGITVSIDGFRLDNSGWLYVDMTVINRSDYNIHFKLSNTYMNGWKISDSETTMFNIASKKNAHDRIRFIRIATEASITAVEQIEDFVFTPVVQNSSDWSVLFTADEMTVTFSW